MGLQEQFIECLKTNPDKPLTASEIAKWIYEHYPAECEAKKARSKGNRPVLAQIQAEIGDSWRSLQRKGPEFSNFKRIEDDPHKFYYSTGFENGNLNAAPGTTLTTIPSKNSRKERELYPILAEYLKTEWGLYTKRIEENRSSNTTRNRNMWLHPDLVSLEPLSGSWDPATRECAQHYGGRQVKLWSFEVKVSLPSSEVRSSFFQAVSNSSWANLGYLVSGEPIDTDVMEELRILSGLHGIGVIRLDANNLEKSRVVIPAREKTQLDWDTINRMTTVNRDFSEYIEEVLAFYQRKGKVNEHYWEGALPSAHSGDPIQMAESVRP